ncbi:NB-ARC-like protein [Cynara cardunculus var. scolymus]|uniref:NB-ARC-like protein n=1 Tax=Cynara cardunculus var. scolymus TaxID=59895 RepID=A0A103Y4E3_CYNCS|nr:NB-ARC-like protein [Cynara cardunculus var. scolymus]
MTLLMTSYSHGTKATTGILLWSTDSEFDPKILKGLGNMKNLRYLLLDLDFDLEFDEVSQYLPNALRCLCWYRYPFGSLPRTFEANNLVGLYMPESRIVQVWEGGERKVLKKLRFLTFIDSNLKSLDLGLFPNLEKLNIERCYNFEELHIPVECLRLKSLVLKSSKLRTLDLRGIPYLETLSLHGCHDLVELHIPVECLRFKSLVLDSSKLRTLDLRGAPNLKTLKLGVCYDLIELHVHIKCLKLDSINIMSAQLRTFDLGWTPNLKSLVLDSSKLRALDLRGTPYLETLSLHGCDDLEEPHIPVEWLRLESLVLDSSKLRALDLRGTPYLETLSLIGCDDFVELHIPVECLRLKSLVLRSSKLRTLDLRGTPYLETLSLEGCHDLAELHIPVECLRLKSLVLDSSRLRTLDLRGAPNLETLRLRGCYDLVELHVHIECLKLESIDIMGAQLRTFDLGWTPNLKMLILTDCYHLFEAVKVGCASMLHLKAESLEMCPLHLGNNMSNFRFECFYEEEKGPWIGNLEKLISFGLCACTNLERFSQSICGLRYLRKLTLEGGIPESPKDLDRLECLEELNLLSTKITHLPDSICKLKHLKYLKLDRCWFLETLPEDLGRLECLEKLILSECVFLRHIPDSICNMKRLWFFLLPGCIAIEKLPEEIGRLNRHEVELIKLVVKDISSKLPVVNADGNLIGMRTRINGVVSSLNAFPDELSMIGIVGMGGGGKTTLARAVFDQICNELEGSRLEVEQKD